MNNLFFFQFKFDMRYVKRKLKTTGEPRGTANCLQARDYCQREVLIQLSVFGRLLTNHFVTRNTTRSGRGDRFFKFYAKNQAD